MSKSQGNPYALPMEAATGTKQEVAVWDPKEVHGGKSHQDCLEVPCPNQSVSTGYQSNSAESKL